jgi:polyhydroxyalkanoate synthase
MGFLKRQVTLVRNFGNKEFLRRFKALSSFYSSFTNLPAASYKHMVNFIDENALIKGDVRLMNVDINLKNFSSNLLSVAGSKDSFTPPDSIKIVEKYISSKDVEYKEVPLGHLTLMGSILAKETTWKHCIDWLTSRSGDLISIDNKAHSVNS